MLSLFYILLPPKKINNNICKHLKLIKKMATSILIYLLGVILVIGYVYNDIADSIDNGEIDECKDHSITYNTICSLIAALIAGILWPIYLVIQCLDIIYDWLSNNNSQPPATPMGTL